MKIKKQVVEIIVVEIIVEMKYIVQEQMKNEEIKMLIEEILEKDLRMI